MRTVVGPTAQARTFRSNLTRHEARMWAWLKTLRRDGFHIRRQAPFRGCFLDFVCFNRRLVIELDGAGHGEESQRQHDQVRDAVLAREGFLVLRLRNRSLDEDMAGVCNQILQTLSTRPPVR